MHTHLTLRQYVRSIMPLALPLLLFFLIIFRLILPDFRASLEDDRREQIKELTVTVWHIIDYYNVQARTGSITPEEAKTAAIDHIRHIRFGDESKQYFWINDMEPFMIMHPYRSDLEGQSLADYTDPDGKHLFVEMAQKVASQGAGYVDYKWQWLDDPTIISPKTSYVMAYQPWGWIIGTGMYRDDVEDEIDAITGRIILYSLLILAVTGILLGISFSRTLHYERMRIRSHDELRRSERKYRDLFDLESDALLLVDNATGHILEANAAAERMYGYTHDELMVMSNEDLSADPDATRLATTSGATSIPFRYHKRHDGSVFPVEVSANQVTWDGRESHIASIRDITKRIKMEEALIASEREKDAILNSVTDLVVYHDTDLKIIWANHAYEEMVGLKPGGVIGKYCHEIVHGCDEPCTGCPVLRARDLNSEKQIEMKMKDGKLFSITGFPVHGSDGKVTGIVEVMRDVTQQRALEYQLLHSQKMESIGRLAGGVAHDFNNLLTVILGNADFALMTHDGDADLNNRITEIRTAAERAGNLTRQLLAFSKHQITEPRIISVNTIISELNKLLQRLIGENIIFTNTLTDDVWPVKIDPVQVEQILANLVVNARDAMPDGGTITIETSNFILDSHHSHKYADFPPGEYVMIAVSDTGYGMTDDVKKKIFEPFFSTKEQGKGTGLGLSTCYGIVRQNNGYIWVYSEPNVGTTFKIYLPRSVAEEVSDLTGTATVSVPNGSEKILVVEDDPALRRLAVTVLSEYGYTVQEAEDGEEAISVLTEQTTPFDLMITDVIMPRMGGKELVEKIQSSNGSLKTLYMSGYTDESVVMNGILDEESAFIQKPFAPFQLVKKVRAVLDSVQKKAV